MTPSGCVTACVEATVPYLGVNFHQKFLPALQRYSMSSPRDNHMMGIIPVGIELGLLTQMHIQKSKLDKVNTNNGIPAKANEVHPRVIKEILEISQSQPVLNFDYLTLETFEKYLQKELTKLSYLYLFLDWSTWDKKTQGIWGNPNHVIAIIGSINNQWLCFDAAAPKDSNPIYTNSGRLYKSLKPEQQIISLGTKR